MSAEKIDHKAESERELRGYPNVYENDGGDYLVHALVHATLHAADQTAELVEQQRIANLQREREHASDDLKEAIQAHVGQDIKHEKLMHFLRLHNEVRAGLDLA